MAQAFTEQAPEQAPKLHERIKLSQNTYLSPSLSCTNKDLFLKYWCLERPLPGLRQFTPSLGMVALGTGRLGALIFHLLLFKYLKPKILLDWDGFVSDFSTSLL